MNEERLNELMADAARTYRVPAEPDFDAMWSEIERDAFDQVPGRSAPSWRSPRWHFALLGMAASLLVGVAVGRYSASGDSPAATVATDTAARSARTGDVYDRAAKELLGRTAVLLTALPSEGELGAPAGQFATQALELLTTTRLLLDSPAASDARFKDLLDDLELILAQIASLHSGRGSQEMDLITDALTERDVVPRIQSAVARLASGDDD